MPRFSEWAGLPPPAAEPSEKRYLLDNRSGTTPTTRSLKSKSSGVFYRRSPDSNKKSKKLALFGTTVQGVPHGENWLKVGNRYLPMVVDGHPVLVLLSDGESLVERDDAEDQEQQSHLPTWLLSSGAEAKPAPVRVPRAVEVVEDHRKPKPPTPAAANAWYEVVAERAVIRSNPSVNAHIENIKNGGEFVELYEWDGSKEWRRCKDSWQAGWMLLKHWQLGPLLREVDEKLLPAVTPMCEAIMMNNLPALKKWISEASKKTLRRLVPAGLVMAAARGFHDCFVQLSETGERSELALDAGPSTPGLREPSVTRALARAIAGLDFNLADFDAALQLLQPEQQELAEQLFDQAASDLEARRAGRTGATLQHEESSSEEEEQQQQPQQQQQQQQPQQVEEEERPARARANAPSRPEASAAPAAATPSSAAVVVARRVAVREEPAFNADIVSEFRQGDQAQLLDFDASGDWRRVHAKDTDRYGWTLLQHKTLGQLWRLLDEKPAEPEEDSEEEDSEEESDDEEEEPPQPRDGWNSLFGGR